MCVSDKIAYHYYDGNYGVFSSISELKEDELRKVRMRRMRFLEFDQAHYIQIRKAVEKWLYHEFVKKGGKPMRSIPYYFTIGEYDFSDWYEDIKYVKIPVDKFNPNQISFTYTDSFVAFLRRDGHESHRKLFTLPEIDKFVECHGFSSEVFGRPMYVELQYWGIENNNSLLLEELMIK